MPNCCFTRVIHGLRLRHIDDAAADASDEDHVSGLVARHQVSSNFSGTVECAFQIDAEHCLYLFRRHLDGFYVLTISGTGNQVRNFVMRAEYLAN